MVEHGLSLLLFKSWSTFLRRCASVCVVFKCRWGGGKYTLRAFVVVMAATAVVGYCALLLLLPTTQYYLLSLLLLGSATSNAIDVKMLLLFSFISIFLFCHILNIWNVCCCYLYCCCCCSCLHLCAYSNVMIGSNGIQFFVLSLRFFPSHKYLSISSIWKWGREFLYLTFKMWEHDCTYRRRESF